jgi:perosamine synthetase
MIPHNRPTLGLEEQRAADRVLASGWIAQGREVEAFENELCGYLGLPEGHAVAVSSGTAALFLALWILDAQGSTVACPVYACSALVNAIRLAGADPHFVDTAADRPNIDPSRLARATAGFSIIPHMFGMPVDISAATKNGVVVIEDCAQALGASCAGAPVGVGGHVGIFSFYATKMMTSGGEGGMLVARDRGLADAARDYRQFDGRHDRKPRFNFQMTDLQAAIGRVQLGKLPGFVTRRGEIFARYRDAGFDLLDEKSHGVPVRYRSIVRTQSPRAIIDNLARYDIKAIVPVEDWELLGPADQYPNAAALTRTAVSLPTYPSLSDEELSRIIDVLGNDAVLQENRASSKRSRG